MRTTFLALALLCSASSARADVVPPYDCGPGKVWEGGHTGRCTWGVEPESVIGVGTCCGGAVCFGSVVALVVVFLRRRRPAGGPPV